MLNQDALQAAGEAFANSKHSDDIEAAISAYLAALPKPGNWLIASAVTSELFSLQQQLAEKDAEIERLKSLIGRSALDVIKEMSDQRDRLLAELEVAKREIRIPVLQCGYERCSHQWRQRGLKKPKVCPKCKRTNWNTFHPMKRKKDSQTG
jgi:hypothetical protein